MLVVKRNGNERGEEKRVSLKEFDIHLEGGGSDGRGRDGQRDWLKSGDAGVFGLAGVSPGGIPIRTSLNR